MQVIRCFIYSLVLLVSSFALAQEDSIQLPKIEYDRTQNLQPVSFNKEQIKDYKNDSNFDYSDVKAKDSWWLKFKRWIGNLWNKFWRWLLGDFEANSFLAFLIKNLPYVILFLIICFIVYLFIKINPAGQKIIGKDSPKVFLSAEEKIIYAEDIDKLIQKALENKQYRLAVRYSYLLILRKLKDRKIIDYQFQKTNHDYFTEIESKTLNQSFQKITKVYDFVWYGDFPITYDEYKLAEKEFANFQNQLK